MDAISRCTASGTVELTRESGKDHSKLAKPGPTMAASPKESQCDPQLISVSKITTETKKTHEGGAASPGTEKPDEGKKAENYRGQKDQSLKITPEGSLKKMGKEDEDVVDLGYTHRLSNKETRFGGGSAGKKHQSRISRWLRS